MTYARIHTLKWFCLLFLLLFFSSPTRGQVPEGEATLPSAEEISEEASDEGASADKAEEEAEITGEAEATEEGKATEEAKATEDDDLIFFNAQDQDIKDVIKQISILTGKNFIIDTRISGKVTILSQKKMTREEVYQAFLSSLAVAEFTVVEGPAGILKIVSLKDAKQYPIPTHVDTTPYTDGYITRLIKLENINANDMSEAIKGLISRNANLFAYEETNTLVITDSGTNIDRLMKIIKELDQEGPQEVVEIIPIHFASAKEIASVVMSLYEQQQQAGRAAPRAGQAREIAKVSKLIADERTNSIIVLASKRDIDKVKELINRLDAKLEIGSEGNIHVHYLSHAKAADLVSVLQGLAGAAAKPPAQAGQAPTGPVVASLEDFKVAADDATNSLLITSTAKTYRTLVEKVINNLDIPRKQIYLEAMVIEFSLSRGKVAGVSGHGGAGDSNIFGFGQTFQQLLGLFDPFNTASTGSPFVSATGFLGGLLSRRTVTITAADGKSAKVPAFSAFVTALQTIGDTNLVASPNLLALDNEEATIEIIRKEPEPGQLTITGTGLQQQGPPSRVEAGLRLVLKPRITEGGTVHMHLKQEFSSFTTPKNLSLGTQAIVERKVETDVITNDAQTVVIGGLMEDQETISKTKIPILGDIPVLGWLFTKKQTDKSKSNLLLFLTPHIIRGSGDFAEVLQRKVGDQQEFLTKHYKKKYKERVNTVIRGHNADLLRAIGDGTFEDDSRRTSGLGLSPSGRNPIITAKPDEEPGVTIYLPSSEAFPEESKISGKGKKGGKKKREEKPIEENRLEVEDLERKQVDAGPVPPVQPLPRSKQEKKKKKSDHSPVINLPPGSTPDLWE